MLQSAHSVGDQVIHPKTDGMPHGGRPLAAQSAEELLGRAAELDAMAATATTIAVKQSLERLAVRFRALAEERRSRRGVTSG
jgi:hypothetical protein